MLPELVRRDVHIDVVTDQTSAHDPLNGYVPVGMTVEQAAALRASEPEELLRRVGESAVAHVAAIRELGARGAEAFDYGNALRGLAAEHGDDDAFAYPGFVPAYIRPLFCEGKGPFRWVALSGDPEDIRRTDAAILELFGDDEHVARWIRLAGEKVHFQGLPARICWLGHGERHVARACASTRWSPSGELSGADRHRPRPPRRRLGRLAPARDRGDARRLRRGRRLADPQRAHEHRLRARAGSPSITAAAWAWASRSTPGQVVVADGTDLAAERVRRVLVADPGLGVVRHADAGYPEAVDHARAHGPRMPMLDPEPA